jgi:type IV pilus assembly protein PilE
VTRPRTNNRLAGFTLVELVIVMVIIAILASIAIPSYQAQVRQSRRTDAKTALLDLAAREEKYFSLNNAYTNSWINLGYAAATPQPIGSGYYNANVCVGTNTGSTSATDACTSTAAATAVGGTSYVISAIPASGQSQVSDSSCQYFAIDNTGTQFSSSTQTTGANTTTTCWH